MPSSSTGHIPATITREQPSSSGQLLTFSSGCKLNLKSDAELEMESGSTMNIEAGAYLKVALGGYVQIQNYTYSSGGGTISNYHHGYVICHTSGVRELAIPNLGSRIDFICNSTKSTIIKGSSTDVLFTSTATHLIVQATTKTKKLGIPFTLIGASTKRWRVMASHPSSGAFQFITYATAS